MHVQAGGLRYCLLPPARIGSTCNGSQCTSQPREAFQHSKLHDGTTLRQASASAQGPYAAHDQRQAAPVSADQHAHAAVCTNQVVLAYSTSADCALVLSTAASLLCQAAMQGLSTAVRLLCL